MPEPEKKLTLKFGSVLSIAIDICLDIGVPLAGFAFIGNTLANRYDNKTYLIGAIFLAFLTTTVLLYRRINKLSKELTK